MTTTRSTSNRQAGADWMRGVADDKELSHLSRVVGIYIAVHQASSNASSIALSLGVKEERRVREAIAALKARGWLDDRGHPSIGGRS
jgi:hypothetical protein